jgi:hypothetical protein
MSAAVMVDAALALSARYGWALFPARFKKNKAGKWQKLSWKSGPTSNGQRWGATSDPDQIRLDFADPQRCAVASRPAPVMASSSSKPIPPKVMTSTAKRP